MYSQGCEGSSPFFGTKSKKTAQRPTRTGGLFVSAVSAPDEGYASGETQIPFGNDKQSGGLHCA
jgi:hypothetical protein